MTHDTPTAARHARQRSHAALPHDAKNSHDADRDDARHIHTAAGRGRTTRRTTSGLPATTTGAVPGLHCLWGLGTAFFFCFLAVAFAVSLAAPAIAIGITPARSSATFMPGTEIEGRFTVLNDDPQVTNATILVEGDLADMVTVRSMIALGDTGIVNYLLRFPATAQPAPGDHVLRIIVQPNAPGTAGVGSQLQLGHRVVVTVLANGSYITHETHVNELQDSVLFEATVKNIGNTAVDGLTATFELWDESKEHSRTTEPVSLAPGEERRLRATLPLVELAPGIYELRTVITWAGRTSESSMAWQHGAPTLSFVNIPFYLLADQVSPFDLRLQNDWNQPLAGVYADITLFSPEGGVLRTSKTPTVDLAAEANTTLPAFIDMRGINMTRTNVSILLHVEGQAVERIVAVDVLQQYEETAEYTKTISLALIVIGLVVMNVTILLLWHQRQKER